MKWFIKLLTFISCAVDRHPTAVPSKSIQVAVRRLVGIRITQPYVGEYSGVPIYEDGEITVYIWYRCQCGKHVGTEYWKKL